MLFLLAGQRLKTALKKKRLYPSIVNIKHTSKRNSFQAFYKPV
jgi:hypothetical protein